MGHGFRPVICKIEIKNPNKKGTKSANLNFLHYIATREGVDLSRVNSLMDAAKGNYDLTEEGEALFSAGASDELYLKYMSFRPRSHGLFGNIDTENFSKVSQRLGLALNDKKIIYRGVISLSELDGKALGYNNSEKWYLYLKSVMPEISETLGLGSSDVTWVAAFHAEQSHPHVHFMLWDNKDKVRNAFITKSQHLKCREICQNTMFTEENEAIIRGITEAERKEYYSLQNASRQKVLDYFNGIFKISGQEDVPGALMEGMPGRLSEDEHRRLAGLYEKVLGALPNHGRIMYKFMPPECKAYIDQITGMLLKRPDIKTEYTKYMEAVSEIHKLLGKTKPEIKEQCKESENELYTRIGNIVLKGILNMKEEILGDGDSRDVGDINADTEERSGDVVPDAGGNKGGWKSLRLGKGYVDRGNPDRDLGRAAECFRELAELGNVAGKYGLGSLMMDVGYVGFSPEAGVGLLEEAAETGYVPALLKLGGLYMKSSYFERDYARAEGYLNQVVTAYGDDKGFGMRGRAYYLLGKLCSCRENPNCDMESAAECYGKALECYGRALECGKANGCEDMEYKLVMSRIYADREAGHCDYGAAAAVLDADGDGSGRHALQLGVVYADGYNPNHDMEKAVACFRQSARVGNTDAMVRLAKCYLYGMGIGRDRTLAKEWFAKAVDQGNEYAKRCADNMERDGYKNISYILLRQIFLSMQQANGKKRLELNEMEFKNNSKQVKREEYLHKR